MVDKVEVCGHVHVLPMGYQKLPLAFKILPVLQPATALLVLGSCGSVFLSA